MSIWEIGIGLVACFLAVRMLLKLIARHRRQVLSRLVAEEKARRRRSALVQAGRSAADERTAQQESNAAATADAQSA